MSSSPGWLQRFFASDNQIVLDRVLSSSNPYEPRFQALLQPLIASAVEGDWPMLLPVSRDGKLYFYGAEQDLRSLEELRQVLQASLGSADTYPDYRLIKDTEDEAERILLEQAPAGLIRIDLLARTQSEFVYRQRVFQGLATVLALYRQRPRMATSFKRPLGRILRDFFAACQLKDGSAASRLFEELKATGNFSQRNLISLELQTLEAERRWTDIVDHPRLIDFLGGRIPVSVVSLLLRALGHLGTDSLLERGAFGCASLEQLRLLYRPLSPLFATPPLLEVRECFVSDWMRWAVGAGVLGYSEGLLDLPNFVDSDWLDQLREWVGLSIDNEPLLIAAQTFPKVEITEPQNFDEFRLLLERSLSSSMQELQEIWLALQLASEQLRSRLIAYPRLQFVWEDLSQTFDGSRERGWQGWLGRLEDVSADPEVLIRDLQEQSQNWSVESFSETELSRRLHGSTCTGILLRDSLPLLLDWLDSRQLLCSADFWLEWLELLALDDLVNPSDVLLAGQVVQRFLSRPSQLDDRIRLGEALEVLWEKGGSVTAYPGMLEIIELLLEESQPGQHMLQKLWLVLQGFAVNRWARLELSQRYLTKSLAREILGQDCEANFPRALTQDVDSDNSAFGPATMSGKTLAIYSLTEGAARRAKAVLEDMFAGLDVELNHDHTATPALLHLAKKASYFLFVAGSAKHQAFYPVSRIRQDLIYPLGRGASSIIDAFCNYCSDNSLS